MNRNKNEIDDSYDQHFVNFMTPAFKSSVHGPNESTPKTQSSYKKPLASIQKSKGRSRKKLINFKKPLEDCPEEMPDGGAEDFLPSNQAEFVNSRQSSETAVDFTGISNLFDSSSFHNEIMDSFSVCHSSIVNFNFSPENKEMAQDALDSSALGHLCASAFDVQQIDDMMDISAFERSFTQKNELSKRTKVEFCSRNVRGSYYGLPDHVKSLIEQYKGIKELYEWQDECLRLPAVIKRHNLIYALPTSGGKTLVAEILMLREVICRQKNVLFILPFVAIVQEKVWSLSPFAVNLNFLVEEYAAGKGVYPPKRRRRKKSIYVATLEKGLGIVRSLLENGRLDELGLVVIDELHLIGDPSRGHILETMLTNIIYKNGHSVDIQIIGMSATIGNIDELAQFINASVYTKDFRPVELKEYIKNNDQLYSVNYNSDEVFSFEKSVAFGYSSQVAKIDPDHLGGLVMEVIPNSSCLIFCPTKRNCENVAELLCKVIFKQLLQHKSKEKDVLLKTLKNDSGGELCPILTVTIPWGVAYHHSGLTSEERRLLEDAFRSGVLSVLCCTSTLAAGVNLPAQRVILRSPIVGRDFLSLSTYKQMVGRAGRAGFGCCGESILICSNIHMQKVKELLQSPMDQALSALHNNNAAQLKMLILNAIVLNMANDAKSLTDFIRRTLLGVQAERLSLNLKDIAEKTIEDLIQSQAIQYSGLSLEVTKLGKAAIKGCIDLHRAHILYDDLKKAQKCLVLSGILHLLYLVTPCDLVTAIQPNMTTYYTILIDMDEEGYDTAKVIGIKRSFAINMATGVKPAGVSESVLNRFYIALMLRDLWNQESVASVSNRYQVNRGTVQSMMTSAASFSSNVLRFCEEFEEFWAFQDLLINFTKRLAYCCTAEMLPLMELPNVKKARALQLYKAGYKTLQLIAKASKTELTESIEHLSSNTAGQLIAAAKLLLIEKVENLKDEAEEVLDDLGLS